MSDWEQEIKANVIPLSGGHWVLEEEDALRIAREAFEAGKRAAFETAIKIVEVRKAVQEGAALGAGDRRDWDTANYAEACADEATTIIAMLRNRMQPDESLAKEPGDE